MTLSSRRAFFTSTGLTIGALSAGMVSGIEPIKRHGNPQMKLSLAAYSFRQWLDLKKPTKPKWTLFDFMDFAANLPLQAVELTGYYFPETTSDYLGKVKRYATRLGLDVSGTAVGNNFCVPDKERLAKEIKIVKDWTEFTSRLGGKTMRIFAGNVAKGDREEKALERCIEAIQECCEYASKFGVYLAIENHGGVTSTPEQLLKIVHGVNHECFGVNVDTGNFHGEDPYSELIQILPYAVNVQVKTEIQPTKKPKEEADLKKLMEMLKGAKYRGYVALEYEAEEDATKAVPRYVGQLKKLVD